MFRTFPFFIAPSVACVFASASRAENWDAYLSVGAGSLLREATDATAQS